MNEEEKMIWLFEQVDGQLDTRTGCSLEIDDGDYGSESFLKLMKDGNCCWSKTKAELVFDYLTKDL